MLTTIEGTYENGQITLDHQPLDITKAKVKVVFEDEKDGVKIISKRKMGIFKGTIKISADFDEPLDELKDYY
jgi:Protein of unknown function (DUF2281)